MKRKLLIALFLVVVSFIVAAQTGSRSEHNREQTSFGAEDEIQRPVSISGAALKAMRETKDPDGMLQRCADEEEIAVTDVPATWFAASEIQLTQSSNSGLVVRGENGCLLGAHITQFWVLAKEPTGAYKGVFTGRADALDVLTTRSNGYRDLQLVFVYQAGASVEYVKLQYANGTYCESSHRLTHPN